jgi:hypothetical protein
VSAGWFGFDLDGTLFEYNHWRGPTHFGAPLGKGDPDSAYELLKAMLAQGEDCRIVTARVFPLGTVAQATPQRLQEARSAYLAIEKLCELHFGRALPITCIKDFSMIRLFDDRARQVDPKTGKILNA